MLRLNQRQRELLADKLCEFANIAAGALVFGQLFSQSFSPRLAVAGLALWIVLSGWAVTLLKEQNT